MDIKEFIASYNNYPVLFLGSGFSLRYLKNSFGWDDLLEKISFEIYGDNDNWYDIKAKYKESSGFDLARAAEDLEKDFNEILINDRNGKFKEINDIFYEKMREGIAISRFKIYISSILSELSFRDEVELEINEIKKMKKNIASIITTNYDRLIEDIFEFDPLVGNNILLSNPYNSLYKIHGCVSNAESLIITDSDYKSFDQRYELIRAQLVSLFIHNPIIFIGYSVSDKNIKDILKTIFSYVDPNSELEQKIRSNFLLVEYEKDVQSTELSEHSIDIEGKALITINKLRTDNFSELYKNISGLKLPASVLDIRRVQSVFMDIASGGETRVRIIENIDDLENSEKILLIGSEKSINYSHYNVKNILSNYFDIMQTGNFEFLELIDKLTISNNQWFPIFGFNKVNGKIKKYNHLKRQQKNKMREYIKTLSTSCKKNVSDINSIKNDDEIGKTIKNQMLIWNLNNGNLDLDDVERHLEGLDSNDTEYKRILCFFDQKKYDN